MKIKLNILIILNVISILFTNSLFATNGIKEFNIPNYHPNGIIESPINDNIWIIDQNKVSYEFDIETEKLNKLSDKFGDFAFGLKDMIIVDKYDSDFVWLGNFQKGIICYKISSDEFTLYSRLEYFNDEALTVIKPHVDRVWIGTTKNLYYYDRNDKEIVKSYFNKEIWIKSIRKESGNLIINNMYIYDYTDFTINTTNIIKGYVYSKIHEYKEIRNVIFISDQKNPKGKSIFIYKDLKAYIIDKCISFWDLIVDDHLVYYPEKGENLVEINLKTREKKVTRINKKHGKFQTSILNNLYKDREYIWFFDDFGLCRINTDNYEIYKSDISFSMVRSLYANDQNIWIGIDDGFVQISKSYLDSIMIQKNQIEQTEELIQNKRNKLRNEKDPIKFVIGFFEMREITSSHQIMDDLLRFLPHRLVIRDTSDINRFEKILTETNDTKMKEALCYGLITGYVFTGNPHKALVYYSRLKTLNDKSMFLDFVLERDITRLKKAKEQLQSIKSDELTEAEKLFRLGKTYYEMFKVYWNYGEVGINTEYPFSYYMKLLADFPDSEWADNAEFEMLRYRQICSQEGGDNGSNLSNIKKYENFLKEYPDTELHHMVQCIVSSLYYHLMKGADKGCMYPEDLGYLNKADSIIQQIPDDFKDYEYIDNLRKGIKESIEKYSWKINMELDFMTFSQGDSVVISFSLENMYIKPQKISLKSEKGIPNFGVYIKDSSRYPNHFTETFPYVENKEIGDIESYEYTVNVHDRYFEKWDITKTIGVNYFGVLIGHYKFSASGRYEITGYFSLNPRMRLLTEPIIIEIE